METDDFKVLLDEVNNGNPSNQNNNGDGAGAGDAGAGGDNNGNNGGGDNNGDAGNGNNQNNQSQDNNEVEIELSVNNTGDIIDSEGNVIIAADKVEKDQDGTVIIPDDIAKKYTKTVAPETGIQVAIKELEQEFEVQFVDEENKPVVFEDSPKGYAELSKFVANKILDREVNKELETIFQSYPDVEEYLIHRANGGSYETFKIAPQTSITKKAFDDKNEEFLFDVVLEAAIKRGNPKEDARLLAETYEKSGKLLTKAKADYEFLIEKEKSDKAVRDKAVLDARDKQRKDYEEYVTTVKEIVGKKTLKGLKIADDKINSFIDYVTKPTANGLVQANIDAQQADYETRLAIEYLRFVKFDLKSLAENLAKQDAVSKIKFRAAGNVNNADGSGQRTVVRQGSVDDVALDRIL